MTSNEKKVQTIVELATVIARISELKRAKTYLGSGTYYRNRLRTLEEEVERLHDRLENRKPNKEIKLTFNLPQNIFAGLENLHEPEEIIQYLKKEYLVLG